MYGATTFAMFLNMAKRRAKRTSKLLVCFFKFNLNNLLIPNSKSFMNKLKIAPKKLLPNQSSVFFSQPWKVRNSRCLLQPPFCCRERSVSPDTAKKRWLYRLTYFKLYTCIEIWASSPGRNILFPFFFHSRCGMGYADTSQPKMTSFPVKFWVSRGGKEITGAGRDTIERIIMLKSHIKQLSEHRLILFICLFYLLVT